MRRLTANPWLLEVVAVDDRLLDYFIQLTKVDSESLHEGEMARLLMEEMRSLGLEPYMDETGKRIGGEAGNVYVSVPASGMDAPPLLLCAHLDTVSPGRGIKAKVKGDRVVSEGDTILGADCKVGIAVLMDLLRGAVRGEFPHGPLEFLFTVAEEKGLQGVRHLEREKIKSRHALVVDGAGKVGKVIIASPTQDNVKMTFQGRAAHAGVEPEKGINAIYGAAWAISMIRWGRIDADTTANVGVIQGGKAVNIVPDEVVALGEVRSLVPEKLEEHKKAIRKAAVETENSTGVGVRVEFERAYEGFSIPEDDPLVQVVVEGGKAMGMKVLPTSSGGGSDANFLNAAGIRAVVLSMGVMESHSTREFVEVEELNRLSRWLREIVQVAGNLR